MFPFDNSNFHMAEDISYFFTRHKRRALTISIFSAALFSANIAMAQIGVDDNAKSTSGSKISGNVLKNDKPTLRGTLEVTEYSISSIKGSFAPSKAQEIPQVGLINIMANGDYTFASDPGFSGSVPTISYRAKSLDNEIAIVDSAVNAFEITSVSSSVDSSNVGKLAVLDTDSPHALEGIAKMYAGDQYNSENFTFDENPKLGFLRPPNSESLNPFTDPDDGISYPAAYFGSFGGVSADWTVKTSLDFGDVTSLTNFRVSGLIYADDSITFALNGTDTTPSTNPWFSDPISFSRTFSDSSIVSGPNSLTASIESQGGSVTGFILKGSILADEIAEANLKIVVAPTEIIAGNDNFTKSVIIPGGKTQSVFLNDTLGGKSFEPLAVKASILKSATKAITLAEDGSLLVAKDAEPGTYDLTYQICEATNDDNCSRADVSLTVDELVTLEIAAFEDENKNGKLDKFERTYKDVEIELQTKDRKRLGLQRTDSSGIATFDKLETGKDRRVIFKRNGTLMGEVENIEIGGDQPAMILIQIDPSGKIYDANSRDLISGATVTLTDASGTLLPANCVQSGQQGQVTATDGFYRFDVIPGSASACPAAETEYRIAVSPPGDYQPSSSLIPPETGPYNPSGTTTNEIVPNVDRPVGSQPTTYYTSFLLGSGDPDVVHNHIPLDPPSPPITATNDSVSGISGQTGAFNALNVLNNDDNGGTAADTSNVTLGLPFGAVVPPELIFDPATGNVSVATGTDAGTYSFTYEICDIGDPTNFDTAIATVVVTSSPDPIADPTFPRTCQVPTTPEVPTTSLANVNGFNNAGGTITQNASGTLVVPVVVSPIVENDPLQGSAFEGRNTVRLQYTDANPSIAGSAFSNVYTLEQASNIQFIGGPTFGGSGPTAMDRDHDRFIIEALDATAGFSWAVNGFTAGQTEVQLSADGQTVIIDGPLVATPRRFAEFDIGTSGQVKQFRVTHANLVDTGVNNARFSLRVPDCILEIEAEDDDFSSTPFVSTNGGTTPSVFSDDTLDGAAFDDNDVTVSITDEDGLSGVTINADGTIDIPADSPPGTYEIEYEICEADDPDNCTTAIATIEIEGVPSLSMTKVADDAGPYTVGDVITYTYTVTNDGDVIIRDIAITDTHNSSDPAPTPGSETLLTDAAPTGDSTDAAINGSWDVLAPGDILTFTGTYTVTQTDAENL